MVLEFDAVRCGTAQKEGGASKSIRGSSVVWDPRMNSGQFISLPHSDATPADRGGFVGEQETGSSSLFDWSHAPPSTINTKLLTGCKAIRQPETATRPYEAETLAVSVGLGKGSKCRFFMNASDAQPVAGGRGR